MSVLDGPGEGSWSVFAVKVAEERDAALEEVERLKSALEDADLVMYDAVGHARAAADGWKAKYEAAHAENERLKTLLTDIAQSHLIGQSSDWEGPGGRKEAYLRVCELVKDFEEAP